MAYLDKVSIGGTLYNVQDTDTQTGVANVFSTSTAYTAGQYVWYDNGNGAKLYRFTADHAAGAWTGTDVINVALGNDVTDLKSATKYLGLVPDYTNLIDLDNVGYFMITNFTYASIQATTSGLTYIKVPAKPGDVFCIKGTGASSGRLWAFVNENMLVLKRANENASSYTDPIEIYAPKQTAYLIANTYLTPDYPDTYVFKRETRTKPASIQYDYNALQQYVFSTGKIYLANTSSVGKDISKVTTSNSTNAIAFLLNVENYNEAYYPVFKTSASYGSLFLDENNVVVQGLMSDKTGYETVAIPDSAKYMLVSISANWYSAYGNTYKAAFTLFDFGNDSEPPATPFENVNRNMCLAGIKTDILNNKIPYHRGFLFHKLQNNDNTLWYGEDFNSIHKLGNVSYNPTLMRFAVSPKDGRIIAVQRDTRNGIWIWDGTTETHIDDFDENPMAWLYNSGVDFINDGNDEYCIFAEYNGAPTTGTPFNVWRGKYPYTNKSDWAIVKTETYSNITHFHQVRRDPWTNILYLTSGDTSAQSKWWYSTDKGITWTQLVSGSAAGWGNSLCRTINFIFTKDYIYWATDHGENEHVLMQIARDSNTGILDLSTKTKLCDLPGLRATNSLCYVESPNGLFMYDRVDTTPTSEYGSPITFKFYDFTDSTLKDVATLGLTSATWGGSRGKCYVNYTNGKQFLPAMGFSIDTPCIFNLVCDNPANIGTVAFDIGAKTVQTVHF